MHLPLDGPMLELELSIFSPLASSNQMKFRNLLVLATGMAT